MLHGSAALVLLYKIWRIIQADRKEDNLDQAEKEFRNEMRSDIKELREQLKKCEEEKSRILAKVAHQQKLLAEIHAGIRLCKLSPIRPERCPMIERFAEEERSHDD